jgi:tetratricopeptide (TPR) repeat protein
VLKANRLYKDGYVHEAAALYLKAGAGEEPIASYDLANVFSLLGERAPARAMFEAAIAQGAPGIAVRAWYNLGAAFFAERDYEQAAAAFKHGLELRLE